MLENSAPTMSKITVLCRHLVVCAISILLLPSGHKVAAFSVNTADVIATRSGQTATLRCSFRLSTRLRDARIAWEKRADSTSQKIANVSACTAAQLETCHVSIEDEEKYDLAGGLQSGINLQISDISLDDDGVYECKVISIDGIGSGASRLTVTSPPSEIDILEVGSMASVSNAVTYAVAGEDHAFNCSVPSPSNPPPIITWSVGDINGRVGDQMDIGSVDHERLVTSWRMMTIRLSNSDNGKSIGCTAQHDGLTTILNASTLLEVGHLPDGPTKVTILESSVTTTSLVVSWQPGSAYGRPQTFIMEYCESTLSADCETISDIKHTRIQIDRLLAGTSYRIKVWSHTIFGKSAGTEPVFAFTEPLSPEELGIQAIYSQHEHSVHIKSDHNSTTVLQQGLCFQLHYGVNVDTSKQTRGSACVGLGEVILLPPGISPNNIQLVSCGSNLCSAPSQLSHKDPDPAILTLKPIVIIAPAVGGGAVLLALIVIAVCVTRKKSAPSSTSNLTQHAVRYRPNPPEESLQNDSAETKNERPYSTVKYQEVEDLPPGYSTHVLPTSGGNDLYTVHPYQSKMEGNRAPVQYYSSRIKAGDVGKSGAHKGTSEKYGYLDPHS